MTTESFDKKEIERESRLTLWNQLLNILHYP